MDIKVARNQKLAKNYWTLAYRNNIKAVDKKIMTDIVIDVLKISLIPLFSYDSNSSILFTDSSFKNSCKTLFKNNVILTMIMMFALSHILNLISIFYHKIQFIIITAWTITILL